MFAKKLYMYKTKENCTNEWMHDLPLEINSVLSQQLFKELSTGFERIGPHQL